MRLRSLVELCFDWLPLKVGSLPAASAALFLPRPAWAGTRFAGFIVGSYEGVDTVPGAVGHVVQGRREPSAHPQAFFSSCIRLRMASISLGRCRQSSTHPSGAIGIWRFWNNAGGARREDAFVGSDDHRNGGVSTKLAGGPQVHPASARHEPRVSTVTRRVYRRGPRSAEEHHR